MNILSKTFFSLSVFAALALSAHAEDVTINQAELQAFAVQKYRVDFNAQTDKSKADIANEYVQNTKLGDALLKGSVKEEIDFKVAQRQLAIEIWARKFMQNATVDDAAVKALYEKYQPKTAPAYKVRNILVKTESKADSIIKTLSTLKDSTKRIEKFKGLVKSESEDLVSRKNEGDAGWLDLNRFDPSIQAALKDTKKNDIIKAEVKNIGWQVLLIEEFKPEHQASYEEAKAQLSMIAKQELLQQEIKKILESK